MEINKEYSKILISKIRFNRTKLGITQAQLANKINISPIIYSHIESGRRELKILEFVKLSKFLNIKIDEIIDIALSEI